MELGVAVMFDSDTMGAIAVIALIGGSMHIIKVFYLGLS